MQTYGFLLFVLFLDPETSKTTIVVCFAIIRAWIVQCDVMYIFFLSCSTRRVSNCKYYACVQYSYNNYSGLF